MVCTTTSAAAYLAAVAALLLSGGPGLAAPVTFGLPPLGPHLFPSGPLGRHDAVLGLPARRLPRSVGAAAGPCVQHIGRLPARVLAPLFVRPPSTPEPRDCEQHQHRGDVHPGDDRQQALAVVACHGRMGRSGFWLLGFPSRRELAERGETSGPLFVGSSA